MAIDPQLSRFISFQSVAGNSSGNATAIDFLQSNLTGAGFQCHIDGQGITEQPILVAHRPAVNSRAKILIYNHYDVEPAVHGDWISGDPFTLKEIDGRLYGRGIADNKGPLWARTQSFMNLHLAGRRCPEVLWLIQGEEEIKSRSNKAVDLFRPYFREYKPDFYVEETGYNDPVKGDQAVFLWSPKIPAANLQRYQADLSEIFGRKPHRFKYEHLLKFASISPCPFLANLPEDAVYVGFGPNDPTHNIHGKNESLNQGLLEEHVGQFMSFLSVAANIR